MYGTKKRDPKKATNPMTSQSKQFTNTIDWGEGEIKREVTASRQGTSVSIASSSGRLKVYRTIYNRLSTTKPNKEISIPNATKVAVSLVERRKR